MRIHRPTHLLKGLLVAGIAVAGLAGTSVVAHAYPPPKETHSITCSPGHVDEDFGSCSIVFTDKGDKSEKPQGQPITFTVKGRGQVIPSSVQTDGKGQARTTYYAGSGDCSGKHTSVTITGTEWAITSGKSSAAGDETASAQTVVKIDCDSKRDKDDATATTTTATTGSRQNTGASVPGISPAQAFPAVAILAVILMLSVAITGRLRLRRLRR